MGSQKDNEKDREEGGVRDGSRGFSRLIFSKRETVKERGMGWEEGIFPKCIPKLEIIGNRDFPNKERGELKY